MDSEGSRGSSANESDDESPGSPDSTHSRPRSRQSNASRSRSPSKGSRSNSVESGSHNGPRSPSVGSNKSRSRSSSASSQNRSRSRSVPDAPKSPSDQGSRSVSRNSLSPPQSPKRPKSPVSCPQSPEAAIPSIESLNKSKSKESIGSPDSIKSGSSRSSKRSRSRSSKRSRSRSSKISRSRSSSRSSSSSSSRRPSRRNSRDGNTSDSSISSIDSSSRKNKSKADTQPEEISDGDMESEEDKEVKKKQSPERQPEINISHEDLSDVSDLDDSIGAHSEDDKNDKENEIESKENGEIIQQNRDTRKSPSVEKKPIEKTRNDEAGEEQLDFEAEDGECNEQEAKESGDDAKDETKEEGLAKEEKKPVKNREDLEEGEVTDEDDVRPEETEPRPVCRFFSRGACTWGASCRFLHPGVTDKGNYTMFDMVRPMIAGADFMGGPADRIYGKPEPPVVESAWERGLRTAKEMLRKSMKRKEQDIDFEEKKMNLSIAQEEFDKENGYVYGRGASPEPRYVRHMAVEYPARPLPPEDYYQRRQVPYEPEYPPPHARDHRPPPRSYRELPPHRMPDYYNSKYDEQPPAGDRGGERGGGAEADRSTSRRKPKREVIVQQRDERPGRGDEWSDPWMRSKSPGRRKDRKRSYSSGSSSYSSSSSRSSTASTRSSFRSRSKSPRRRGSRPKRSKRVSPSVIVSERKAANERAALMNPPAPKRRAPSPGMMRVSAAANPPAPSREDPYGRSRKFAAGVLARLKGHRRSRSSSGSSSGSSSDSDSSDSSSSSSKSPSPEPRRASEIVKAMDALKSNTLERTKIKLNLKSPMGMRKPDLAKAEAALAGKKRPANSPPGMDKNSKKATSRREELLKQLKAVEDAIAKKRSKVN